MTAWADHGEPTWTCRTTISNSGGACFSFDDLDDAVFGGRVVAASPGRGR